jgi:hypothetical protein
MRARAAAESLARAFRRFASALGGGDKVTEASGLFWRIILHHRAHCSTPVQREFESVFPVDRMQGEQAIRSGVCIPLSSW